MLIFFFIIFTGSAGSESVKFYRWTDSSGTIHISNAPPSSGSYEEFEAPPQYKGSKVFDHKVVRDKYTERYVDSEGKLRIMVRDDVDPFELAEMIVRTKGVKSGDRYYKEVSGRFLSTRIDFYHLRGELRITSTSPEHNSAIVFVRHKYSLPSERWDVKTGKYRDIFSIYESYSREIWALRCAVDLPPLGAKKGEQYLIEERYLEKPVAITLLRNSLFVDAFLFGLYE